MNSNHPSVKNYNVQKYKDIFDSWPNQKDKIQNFINAGIWRSHKKGLLEISTMDEGHIHNILQLFNLNLTNFKNPILLDLITQYASLFESELNTRLELKKKSYPEICAFQDILNDVTNNSFSKESYITKTELQG